MLSEQRVQRQLANIMHEHIGQRLAALRYHFDALPWPIADQCPAALTERAQEISRMIDASLGNLRTALLLLRPPLLEEMGLRAALENDFNNYRREQNRRIHWRASGSGQRQPIEIEHTLFMICREAVDHVIAQSVCHEFGVTLNSGDNELILTINDDGDSCNPRDELSPDVLWLVGLRERAAAIGARFDLRTYQDGISLSVVWSNT